MKHQLKKLFTTAGLVAAFVSISQAQPYYVAGDFNGWNSTANQMVAGPNANEYSYTITGGTPGGMINLKVTTAGFANAWPSGNMVTHYDPSGNSTIHFWPGSPGDGWLPFNNRVGYDDPGNLGNWGLAGDFNGFDGTQALITNSLGNGVYSNSIVVATAGIYGFKFQNPAGSWSDIYFGSDFANGGNNGSITTTTSPQTLPVLLDLPNGRYLIGTAVPTPPTNYITFQLDMSEQVAFGNFTNNFVDPSNPSNTNSVAIAGDFIGWGTGAQLTNNPSLPDLRSNIYSGTFPYQAFLPATINVKFRVNNLDGGYEQPASTAGGNRVISITNANQVLPVTLYDDLGLGDLLYSNCAVTFSVYVTNGQTIYNGGSFDSGSDQIFVNGNWLGWNWAIGGGSGVQMIASDIPNVYTNTLTIPKGNSIYLTYKYSFDGLDNENGQGTNHIREVRSYGSSFVFPQDVWSYTVLYSGSGNYYPNPGLASTNIVEPDFGNLKIASPSAGSFPITWLGRPAVVLQSSSHVSGGWSDYIGTDATQSTNWPANASGSVQFFRLKKY